MHLLQKTNNNNFLEIPIYFAYGTCMLKFFSRISRCDMQKNVMRLKMDQVLVQCSVCSLLKGYSSWYRIVTWLSYIFRKLSFLLRLSPYHHHLLHWHLLLFLVITFQNLFCLSKRFCFSNSGAGDMDSIFSIFFVESTRKNGSYKMRWVTATERCTCIAFCMHDMQCKAKKRHVFVLCF